MNCIAPGPIETEVMIWTFSCFCLDSLDCFAFCLIMLGLPRYLFLPCSVILQGAFGRLDPTGEAGKTMMDQIPVVGQLWYLEKVNLVQTHRTLATGANWRDRGNCKSGHLSLLRLCQVDTSSFVFFSPLNQIHCCSWVNAETVTLDGGEFRMLAGEFNKLRQVEIVEKFKLNSLLCKLMR